MALRNYELMMVLLPTMEDDDVGDLLGRVNRYVEENGGSVENQEKWGNLRKLAFPINDYTEGNYILSNLRLEPESVEQLEAMIEVWESVLRHLVIRVDEFQQVNVASVEPTGSSAPPAVASEESTADSVSEDSIPAVASEEPTGDSASPDSDQKEAHDESTEDSTSESDEVEDNSSESDPAESESDSGDKKE